MADVMNEAGEFLYAVHCAACGTTQHLWSFSGPVNCESCGNRWIAVKLLED